MYDRAVRRLKRTMHGAVHPSSWRIARYLAEERLKAADRGRPSLVGKGDTPPGGLPVDPPGDRGQFGEVPRIIFQTWKSRSEIPANFRYWRSTFESENPQWQCLLWDDADNRSFITTQ